MKDLCICGSGKTYRECCLTFHKGKLPPTALELMRSRYSAYALGKENYILKTTHPENPLAKMPIEFQKKQIIDFCRHTQFNGLEILEAVEGDDISTVTFHASLSQQNKDTSFTEKSYFRKMDGSWLYLRGEIT